MLEQNESSIFDLSIDNEGSASLAETAKWAKVVAIFGLIVGVLIVLAGFFLSLAGAVVGSVFAALGAIGPYMGIFYIAFGAIMIYPNWKLLKFGSSMSPGLRKSDQLMVNDALKNLKSYFKILGIFMLVMVGIYVLAIVVVMSAGSFMR
jgi:hypothetical protein